MITSLLLLILVAGAIFSFDNARQNAIAEVKSTEKLVLYLFDSAIIHNQNIQKLDRRTFNLQHLSHMRHLKIQLLDNHGELLDSNISHQELAQAETPYWFIALLNQFSQPWESSTIPLEFNGATLGKLVITPDPSYEYAEKWKQMKGLFSLLLIFLVLVNFSVIWVVTLALKPTEKIYTALNELEQGNLDTRLPNFKLPELSRIGVKFNLMIAKLQTSIQQNHQLTRQLITLQEQERKNLARDLHDEFGQCLTAINTDATVVLKASEKKYPELKQSAQAISQLSRHLMDLVSGMLQKLRPSVLDELGLEPALEELIHQWQTRHADIKVTSTFKLNADTINETLGIAVYRLIQESLTNISKHAHASAVSIEVRQLKQGQQNGIDIQVRDNGIGLPANHNGQGMGLPGMRERVEGLGGQLKLTRENGTLIQAWIPLA
jgi:two-component system sensor histidine kinase UhpB